MRRAAAIFLLVAAAGCARPQAAELTDVIADQLSTRYGRPMEVQALEQVQANGHLVVCGFYGEPRGVSPKAPFMQTGPFLFIDGHLSTDPDAEVRPLVERCKAKFPGPLPVVA